MSESHKTKRLSFYGSSDDNFCYAVNGRDEDEFGCFNRPCNVILRSAAAEQRMRVTGIYAPGDGCTWSVGLSPVDEDEPLPPWPVAFEARGYTAVMHIDVPGDVTVTEEAAP